jgi:hypothetical protein
MKEDDPNPSTLTNRNRPCRFWGCCRGSWSKVGEHAANPLPRLSLDDLNELRSPMAVEKKFVIQFQATHKDNYGDTLTQSQLAPLTRSVYGTMRFAYPLVRTSHHDARRGLYTVLAMALPDTYEAWAAQDHWPHIAATLLGNYWTITLVAEVALLCETAESGLDILGRATRARSGSE